MAISFKDTKGAAQKGGEYFKFKDGENRFRLVGDVIPRYVYWKKNGDQNLSVECLGFDREQEKFTNVEKDWFRHYFNEKDSEGKFRENCAWSYVGQVIDLEDGKVKLIGHKKKLFQAIIDAAETLGDPTDPETGLTIH